jgi:hypothetical protein
MNERHLTPETQHKPSYEPPEMIEIGAVAEKTLGWPNRECPDGCDCTKDKPVVYLI